MKKYDLHDFLNLLPPVLLMLLGLVLVVNPDSASALVAMLLGWVLIIAAIGCGISAIASERGRILKTAAAVGFAVIGGWLHANPLLLAAWIGRFVGLLLIIDGLQDLAWNRSHGRSILFPAITGAIGAILLLLPLTTSRLIFTLCGIVVMVMGFIMLLQRLPGRKFLDEPEDPNIIDAL